MDQEQSPHRDGAAAGPSAAPTPELLASLDRIGAEVAVLQRASTLSLSDAEHGRALTEVYRMRARLEAAYLHLLRTFDTRPDAVPGVAARTVAATHLIHACHLDPVHARRDVSAAHAVDPDGSGVIPDTAENAPPSSSGLPRVGAALAAGATSRAHLDAAARCLKGIPAHLLNEVDSDGWSGAARVDAYLAEQATQLSARDVARLGEHLLAMLDPDGQDSFDPDAHTRRELTYHTDATGMLVGRFALDPASGSLVRAAISALVKSGMTQPDPGEAPDSHHEDGQPVQPLLPLPDDRTPAQRRADAFTDLALRYLHGDSGTGSAEDGAAQEGAAQEGAAQAIRPARRHRPPTTHVHVWATAAQIAAARAAQPAALDAAGHPIQPPGTTFRRPACGLPGPSAPGLATDLATGDALDPGTFSRLLCDALLDPTLFDDNGAVLAQGLASRLATTAQRRALMARDRGCIVPGCTAPVTWCDAHHVVWWRHGGPTDIDNLVLLCARHHTAVHAGHWQIQMIDGIPWVLAPWALDPTRTPCRSTLWRAEHQARQLGQHLRDRQLHLDLPGP